MTKSIVSTKSKRAQNRANAEAILTKLGVKYVSGVAPFYRYTLAEGAVVYYPGSGRWWDHEFGVREAYGIAGLVSHLKSNRPSVFSARED